MWSKLYFNLDAQPEIQILNRLQYPSDLVSNTSNNASPKSKVNEESFLFIFITVPLNKLLEIKKNYSYHTGINPMFLPHLLSQKNKKYPNCSQSFYMLRLFVVSKNLTFQNIQICFPMLWSQKYFFRSEITEPNAEERNLKIKVKIRIITSVFGTNLRSSMVDR